MWKIFTLRSSTYYFCQGRAARKNNNNNRELIFTLSIISSQLNDDDKVKADDEKITLEWTATTFLKKCDKESFTAENFKMYDKKRRMQSNKKTKTIN